MKNNILTKYQYTSDSIVVYHSDDDVVQLDVQLSDETVWLSQKQMSWLFDTTPQNITIHINNVYKERELTKNATCKNFLQVQREGERTIQRKVKHYNLDVIISVGYRVKSQRGTQFRQWANRILKEHLLRGYTINQHLTLMEQRIDRQLQEHSEQIHGLEKRVDFFVRTSLPPKEGIFFDGQIFDAYTFVSDLIRTAKRHIVLFDNYVDYSVLTLLDKRNSGVDAKIYTRSISPQLSLDLQRHNAQYPPIAINVFQNAHDRFLCIDDKVYHIGASLKDLGKKWFAFSKMEVSTDVLITKI
jgi:hypothetical protein